MSPARALFNMHNNAAFVEFDAFRESSASNTLRSPLADGKGKEEVPLVQCINYFPHAGSNESVASKLPFPTAAVCKKTDTIGIVRLVSVFDNIVPDVTMLRFYKSSLCRRVLTIQVPRASCTAPGVPALFVLTPDVCAQACIFWGFIIALTLLNITTCLESTRWLSRQSTPTFLGTVAVTGIQWSYGTRLCAIWAAQQLVNLMLLPMLNLRKFNGKASQQHHKTYYC